MKNLNKRIEEVQAMLDEAIALGDDGHAEELNYELDELYNAAEQAGEL